MKPEVPFTQNLSTLRRKARERFLAGRRAETQYGVQLRKVAKHVGDIVLGMAPDGIIADPSNLIRALNRYAELLAPWARAIAARMVTDVNQRDTFAWTQHGREIGRALRKEIEQAPTGEAMRRALASQVHLITSLPREAAERVHKLTTEASISGRRAADIAKEIARTAEVTKSRAMLIARTEVSRTATELTKARAQHVGSPGYYWRTSRDGDVRPSHKAMEGKFVSWSEPPTLDNLTGHAGALPNCRCFAEVMLPADTTPTKMRNE